MKTLLPYGSKTLTGCAGETVKELVVQVHCSEGVAIRAVPEPCGSVRESVAEASAGVRAGQPLSHEMIFVPVADRLQYLEGNTARYAIASGARIRRGRRTWHVRTLFDWEPGDLQSDRHSLCSLAARIGKVRSQSR
jgi:hypothetical protein